MVSRRWGPGISTSPRIQVSQRQISGQNALPEWRGVGLEYRTGEWNHALTRLMGHEGGWYWVCGIKQTGRQSDVGRQGSGTCECALRTVRRTATRRPRAQRASWQLAPVWTRLERVVGGRWPRTARRWMQGLSAQTPSTWALWGTSWTRNMAGRSATDMPPI